MKKAIIIALVIAMGTLSAHAGSARRHTIEGFLIGTGAVLLGTAIYQNMKQPAPPLIHHNGHHRKGQCPPGYGRREHWEIRRVWVPAEHETRWNPGHYNRHGKWVTGRYEAFKVSDGYWRNEKVRVKNSRRWRRN